MCGANDDDDDHDDEDDDDDDHHRHRRHQQLARKCLRNHLKSFVERDRNKVSSEHTQKGRRKEVTRCHNAAFWAQVFFACASGRATQVFSLSWKLVCVFF